MLAPNSTLAHTVAAAAALDLAVSEPEGSDLALLAESVLVAEMKRLRPRGVTEVAVLHFCGR